MKREGSEKKVRVIQYGVGAVGAALTKFLLEKEGFEIVGAIDADRKKIGRDLGKVVGVGRELGVAVSDDADAVFSEVPADICLHATLSFLEQTYTQLLKPIEAGMDVISTCEELAYPYIRHPDFAEKIDKKAREHGVTVLGTGSNPGFAMDTLVITLTGICRSIERIEVSRSQDWSGFGPTVMNNIRAGEKIPPDEFRRLAESRSIPLLHTLPDSMHMIADAVGWKLTGIKESYDPIYARTPRRTPFMTIESGALTGFRQSCEGTVENRPTIIFHYIGGVFPSPEEDGVEIEDRFVIRGIPNLNLVVPGGISSEVATPAICINMIPHVINARPGLVTMKDLPIPSALLGNASKLIWKNPVQSNGI